MKHVVMAYRSFRLLPFFFLAGLTAACRNTDGSRDIRDFYFPVRELTGGLVYEYQPVGNDSLNTTYWYYRSFIFPDSVVLTGTYYEYDLLPLQFTREEMVSNGMLLQEMYLYDQDSAGVQVRIEAEISSGSVFPFLVRDSGGIFLFNISWTSPLDPGAVTRVIKNRRFAGDTTFAYKGNTHDAVVFDVRELIEYDKEGVLEQEFRSVEIYAEDLGLVYYRKDIAPDFHLEYRLSDRYPMKQLEEKFMEMYHPEVGN